MRSVLKIDPDTYETVATYKSLAEAVRTIASEGKYTGKSIPNVCYRGSVFTACRYLWRYADDIEPELPDLSVRAKELKQNSKKPVLQLDPDLDVVLATFGSAFEASRATNISRNNIYDVCIGNRKTAGGYRWMYA